MKDLLSYKEFLGSVHFDSDDRVFHGRIEGIEDLVSFEGTNVTDLVAAFHEAVEDYRELCRQTGKKASKSYKGSFNVRIPVELHRRAARRAVVNGVSLNQLVQQALEAELSVHPP